MATSKAHYQDVLAEVYSWMYGGLKSGLARNRAFFDAHGVSARGSKRAVDLGAGSGFQSIPLAELGFDVTAIDLDAALLSELEAHAGSVPLRTIEDDLCAFRSHCEDGVELVVCMTDTILHLDTPDSVATVCREVWSALEEQGRFILTFRDLTHELAELDRFIPVQSDESTIFTCFLEYEPQTVKVHDLVYSKQGEVWQLKKSFYRKLRLDPAWVGKQLRDAGFADVQSTSDNGLSTIIATKI